MTEIYVVQMRLVCDRIGGDATAGFHQRWRRGLERRWRWLAYSTDLVVEDRLNGEIHLLCRSMVEHDLGEMVTGVEVFAPGHWAMGTTGTYEAQRPIIAVTPGGNVPWAFSFGGGQPAGLHAWASLSRRTIAS